MLVGSQQISQCNLTKSQLGSDMFGFHFHVEWDFFSSCNLTESVDFSLKVVLLLVLLLIVYQQHLGHCLLVS